MHLWRRIGLALLVASLSMVAARVGANSPGGAPVLLNEILGDPASDWDGSGALSSRDDEWIEIVNVGPGAVDLAGYRLAGADTTWRYEFSGILAAGGVAVVYGSQSWAWEDSTGNPKFGLRLANGGGTLGLWRLTEAETTLVDCYSYQDHEADDDRSTGRAPDGGDSWRVFDGLNPYPGEDPPLGTGCSPSPGTVINCPTPVETVTWGRIKRAF